MKKPIAAFTIVALLITVGVFIVRSNLSSNRASLDERDLILRLISKSTPMFQNNNQPTIKIDRVAKLEDEWYIIEISSLRETKNDVPVYFIMHGTSSSLRIILGPDTHFTETELLRHNVPDSVILELRES